MVRAASEKSRVNADVQGWFYPENAILHRSEILGVKLMIKD